MWRSFIQASKERLPAWESGERRQTTNRNDVVIDYFQLSQDWNRHYCNVSMNDNFLEKRRRWNIELLLYFYLKENCKWKVVVCLAPRGPHVYLFCFASRAVGHACSKSVYQQICWLKIVKILSKFSKSWSWQQKELKDIVPVSFMFFVSLVCKKA